MQQFKNILLIVKPEVEESVALERAVSLAKKNEARLTILSVLNKPPGLSHNESVLEQLLASSISECKEWLRGLLIQHEDIEVKINVVVGTHFLEIIRQVLREEHDLLITTAEDKQGFRTRLFGTTSMHLMRKCPCPVWVIKGTQAQPFKRILAAVDPTDRHLKRDSLNPLILRLAASLARKEAAELHIIHVRNLLDRRYVRRMSKQDVQELITHEKMQYQQLLDTLLNQVDFTSLKPHMHLVEGDPDLLIPKIVATEDIDLLVMGTVCRTGIAGFLIGNTAEEVLNQVDCSVLTLKPEGFITPVTLEEKE